MRRLSGCEKTVLCLCTRSLARGLHNGGKGLGVIDGQFCQHLAVDRDVCLFEIVGQAAVGYAVVASGCVDADDPQAAHIAFAVAAVAIGVGHGLHPCFISSPKQLTARPKEAFRLADDLLMATACYGSCFYSHNFTSN
jgi:hypothetical protein